jgi:UDP-N-acetylmuramoyl-L-alanyl-D-glutamate--2,6-diaminopimelate ligase
MQKDILDFLKDFDYISVKANEHVIIKGLAYDSRETKPDYAFFAIEGEHVDGHKYIEQAIDNGAKAVFHRKNINTGKKGIIYIKVKNTRIALSQAAAWFYENPSHNLVVVAVTGTDGKSTTVWFIQQLQPDFSQQLIIRPKILLKRILSGRVPRRRPRFRPF